MSHSFVAQPIKRRGPLPARSAVWSRSQQQQLELRNQQWVSRLARGASPREMSHSFVAPPIKRRGPPPARSAVWSRSQQQQLELRNQQRVSCLAWGASPREMSHSFVAQPIKRRGPLPARSTVWLRLKRCILKGLEFLSLSDSSIVDVWVFGIAYLTMLTFEDC